MLRTVEDDTFEELTVRCMRSQETAYRRELPGFTPSSHCRLEQGYAFLRGVDLY
jgi:hypothetical protein